MAKSSLVPAPYKTLEAVRGIASVWVVFFHAALLMGLAHPFIKELPGMAIFRNGYLGVQVFFVVSGYCIASAACSTLSKVRPIWAFTIARLRRIYPPCWASLVLIAAASLVCTWLVAQRKMEPTSLSTHDLPHRSLMFYMTNLSLTQLACALPGRAGEGMFLSDVCWTLCYEMAFYFVVGLALALMIPIFKTKSRDHLIIALLTVLHIITAACTIILIATPQSLFYPFDLWPQFGLGVAVFDIVRHRNAMRAWSAFLGICSLILVFLYLQSRLVHSLPIGQTQQPSFDTFTAALIAAVLLLAIHRFDGKLFAWRPVRWAGFVGTFSYSLYLVNFFFIAGLMIVYKKLSLPDWAHVPAICGLVLLVLPMAYLFFRVFEKPFLKSRNNRKDGMADASITSINALSEPAPVGPTQG